jgi:hypothetical protein
MSNEATEKRHKGMGGVAQEPAKGWQAVLTTYHSLNTPTAKATSRINMKDFILESFYGCLFSEKSKKSFDQSH